MAGEIDTHAYRAFRKEMKERWRAVNAPCGICTQRTIDWDAPKNDPESFELDHIIPRRRRPDLVLEVSNAQPSHHRCNRHKSDNDSAPALGITSEAW